MQVPLSLFYLLAWFSVPFSLYVLIRNRRSAWIGLGNLLYLAAILVKGGPETYNWYFTLPVFSLAILIPNTARDLRNRFHPFVLDGLLMLLCATVFLVSVPTIGEHLRKLHEEGEFTRETTLRELLRVETNGRRGWLAAPAPRKLSCSGRQLSGNPG